MRLWCNNPFHKWDYNASVWIVHTVIREIYACGNDWQAIVSSWSCFAMNNSSTTENKWYRFFLPQFLYIFLKYWVQTGCKILIQMFPNSKERFFFQCQQHHLKTSHSLLFPSRSNTVTAVWISFPARNKVGRLYWCFEGRGSNYFVSSAGIWLYHQCEAGSLDLN